MSKILIVDDEQALVDLLAKKLVSQGHEVFTAADGRSGVALARAEQPDLILLDIMMPEMDGFEVCQAIRDEVVCPILFLSARQAETDKIRGLSLGGDDYITKPFGIRELMARIEANLRRERRAQSASSEHKRPRLYFGALALDLRAHSVQVQEVPVALTKHEYAVVEFLALHPGQIFSKDQIYEAVWGYDAEGSADVVAEHLRKARTKLKAQGIEDPIATVWGIGYRWVAKEGEQ
ncbi:MAG: response regulator transcription factor [Peptococcaceae bacterium]|nr:response regulator transcription factor [Peptococcaceae bacterium]